MFVTKWFAKLIESLKVESSNGFVSNHSPQIYNLRLKQVDDPFNAELLWQHHAALGDQMQGEDQGQWHRDWRLYAALKRYAAPDNNIKDDKTGRILTKKQYFTDVIIWIPQSLWKTRVQEERGRPCERLIENIEQLHYDAFKQALWNERRPRYCVMPADDLATGNVVCQFGTDIFLPSADNVPIRYLAIYDDLGNEYTLPPLLFYQEGRLNQRPAAWYKEQHALQLSANTNLTRPPLPFWLPNLSEQTLRLRYEPLMAEAEALPLEVKLGELSPKSMTRRGEQEFTFTISGKTLRLVVQPVSLEKTKPNDNTAANQGTIFPIFATPTLVVQGIALGALTEAIARLPQAAGWQLFLDEQGGIAGQVTNTTAEARLYQTLDDKLLYWQNTDQTVHVLDSAQTQTVGNTFYTFEDFSLASGQTQDWVLVLPNPEIIPLSASTLDKPQIYRVGRAPQANSQHGETAIALNLLELAGSIFRWQGQAPVPYPNLSLGQTLSAEQVELILEDGKLWVSQLSRNIPTVLLDQVGNCKKRLSAGTRAKAVLEAGEYLWMGPYVLQFVDPKAAI
jgi:hypothetical protein